ncbi:MAG: hypothetical protein LBL15_06795 [Oscillospiraceae bacterium]|jgi:hypothetical protein|nr:hypothetical protein [Oscillospiraceae bacterium]
MILNEPGQIFMLERSCYYIGQDIVANGCSAYAGLPGVVTEIRDGGDKETDNPAADIYCQFTLPENARFRAALADRFSMPANEIPLDTVIMAPGMLEPKMAYQINPATAALYALFCCAGCADENSSRILGVSADSACLGAEMSRQVRNNKKFNIDGKFSLEAFDVRADHYDDGGYTWTAENDTDYFDYTISPVEYLTPEPARNGGSA